MTSREHLARARALLEAGDTARARGALTAAVTSDDELATWLAASRLVAKLGREDARRTLRVAVLSSHTGGQFTAALGVAASVHGLHLETYQTGYRTYEHEILDPGSDLYAFAPDAVVLAADQREVRLPELSTDPEADLTSEVERWTGLWSTLTERAGATVLHLTFVPPLADALGSHGAVHPGGRRRLLRRLNLALGEAAGPGVHLVDLESVAYAVGEAGFSDPAYWFRSKHAIGLAATPAVAQAVGDTLAAAVGAGRKLVVLDLDNTLWGGVIGEDGLGGITLGDGPTGEAFVEVQRYLSSLRQRGLLLAVSSKNDPEVARLPFEQHPEMVLRLEDFVAFETSWEPKAKSIIRIAEELDLGLEAVVFVDDNPAERAAVRHELPMVGVVELPPKPSGYVRAVAAFPGLQTVSVTAEDLRRTDQYRARRQATELEASSGSREDYLAGLQMRATVEPLLDVNRNRVVQLIGKTNQFNLTGYRHTTADVDRLDNTDRSLVWGLRLTDRFDDHGLVSVLIGVPEDNDPETLRIDTFVMSCRVLGRTVETTLLTAVVDWAGQHGYRRVLGHFIPSGRNTPAATVLPDAGFHEIVGGPTPAPAEHAEGPVRTWEFLIGQDDPTDATAIDFSILDALREFLEEKR